MSVKGSSDHAGPQCALHLVGGWQGPWRNEGVLVGGGSTPPRPSYQQGAPALGRGQVRGVLAFQRRWRPEAAGLQLRWCPAPSPGMLARPRESLFGHRYLSTRSTLGMGRAAPTGRPSSSPAARQGGQTGSPHRGHSRSERSEAGQALWPRGTWKASWMRARRMGLERKSRVKGRVCATWGLGEAAGQMGRQQGRCDLGLGCQVSWGAAGLRGW